MRISLEEDYGVHALASDTDRIGTTRLSHASCESLGMKSIASVSYVVKKLAISLSVTAVNVYRRKAAATVEQKGHRSPLVCSRHLF